MTVLYNELQNKIMELLIVPAHYLKSEMDDNYTKEQLKYMVDYAEDIKFIQEKLEPYAEKIKNNYFIFSKVLMEIYIKSFKETKKIKNMTTFFDYVLSLEEEKLIEFNEYENMVKEGLLEKKDNITKEDLIIYFDNINITSEQKWGFTKSILNIEKSLLEAKEIYEYVESFYTDFYNKCKKIRNDYRKNFELEKFLRRTEFIDTNLIADIIKTENNLFIFSPPVALLYFNVSSEKSVLGLSTLTEKLLNIDNEYREEEFFEKMQLLSDGNRYNVLKLLTQDKLRNKEIAEKLNITPAGVSFHIKKLVDSKFLVFGNNNEHTINQLEIKNIIEKLEKDFL
ncbi:winged helix-turn-helix domain-containing protein [Gemelliphila palaticanis]|uniref:Winged helix-turn-helix transcriptional regulator n=1 Tax=Gemelliphila palaticanis TaxID=81950 RepID=A0ABX2SZL7_9BACL|nr:winged helix-turn-helix domain-containing protein [Gemella palaticanis]MBF0715895.1 winged helix-turn-helix transcriptional regulator [Gemella palaticanis]NYS47825.1 winged helix-turn-helix transcriptional regulator [Gemella palaticanis]